MTLNEIFDSINTQIATVNGIVDSLSAPYTDRINFYYNQAQGVIGDYGASFYTPFWHIDEVQSNAIGFLLLSYRRLVDDYESKVAAIRNAVDVSFSDYYDSITYDLEFAITETWNEINRAETSLYDLVEQNRLDVESQIQAQVSESESFLTGMIETVEYLLGIDVQSLWEGIAAKATEIYDHIASEMVTVYNTVTDWIDELWTTMGSFIDWVESEFSAYYTAVRQWIDNLATDLYNYMAGVIQQLTSLIEEKVGEAMQYIQRVYAMVLDKLSEFEAALRAWVQDAIEDVQELLTELSVLADWRFQFLNIFMSYPELSFLQVLNRDDETFNRYKPYWQALFTRVMEPA